MELEEESTPIVRALGLGRLALLLVVSILAIAAFWHVMYGLSVVATSAVVAEIGVILILALGYAWRSAR
jgi:hypothetical protein